jgi:Holliday junction resolvase RusA-like endonuclease
MIVLDIPRATPSMNATHHKHWRVMHQQKKLWAQEIWLATGLGHRLPQKAPTRAKVTLVRYGRRLDVDNFMGGLKSVLDGLKAEGLIADDDAEHLELVATQEKGVPRTLITIEAA